MQHWAYFLLAVADFGGLMAAGSIAVNIWPIVGPLALVAVAVFLLWPRRSAQ